MLVSTLSVLMRSITHKYNEINHNLLNYSIYIFMEIVRNEKFAFLYTY